MLQQKNRLVSIIILIRSSLALKRLYMVTLNTITTETAANISGRSDLSYWVRKNVSRALEAVMLAPIIQKNISIKIIAGYFSSLFILKISISV